MSNFQPEVIVESLFKLVRRDFKLGMQEYLAALDAVRGGFGSQDLPTLRSTLELLWCHSRAQQKRLDELWERVVPVNQRERMDEERDPLDSAAPMDRSEELPEVLPTNEAKPLPVATTPEPETNFHLAPLPVRAPVSPLEMDTATDLEAYWLVTRRSMGYFWRYLRRPRADGPMDVLDLRETVEQAAQMGVFLGPVYRRREVNHAHLMLFIDQEGSMTPLHRFTRDVVETAQDDSTLDQLGIYYFYNVPGTHVYQDSALAKPILLSQVLMHCDSDTSVIIISDAGSARGQRQMRRFRETTMFIAQLKQRTNLIGWLNPMPKGRWANTTAGSLARLVPMAQMNDDGFSHLIDIVRGQSLAGWHMRGGR
jgi:uncharacterized protein